jgi:hypothetical protein
MPGEFSKSFFDKQTEPDSNYGIVAKAWNRKGDYKESLTN